MRQSAVLLLLFVLGLLSSGGCATRADLDKLKLELQGSIEEVRATKKQGDEQLHQVSQEIKALQESLAKASQSLKEDHNRLVELSEVLTSVQSKLNETNAKYETLAKGTDEFRSTLQASRRTVHELLKMQETAYKDGLRTVQSLMKEFEPAEQAKK